jgi:hypothetical protein
MVDRSTVRRLAMALPEVEAGESVDTLDFSVAGKGLCWRYQARLKPKARKETIPGVLAVRCAPERKEMLLEAAPEIYFDDDHYRSFPAVLVRLEVIGETELAAMLEAAWRIQAPKALVRRCDSASERGTGGA